MAYSEAEAKQFIIEAGKQLVKSGLIARTWGNISARISATQFAITPSGRAYETLQPEDIVIVNITDGTFSGSVRPSSEKGVHAAAYKLRKDINFVIHTHQVYASALSILGKHCTDFEQSVRDVIGKTVPTAAYGMSSTKKLTNAVAACIADFPDSKAVLMKYHGALCMGSDYENAFAVSEALERMAKGKISSIVSVKAKQVPKVDLGSSVRKQDKFILTCHGVTKEYFLKDEAQLLHGAALLHACIYQNYPVVCIAHISSPFVMAASRFGKTLYPYIDDQAQIIGTSIRTVKGNNKREKDCKSDGDFKKAAEAFGKNNAVFLFQNGALCVGNSMDDIEAAGMVLEKGCLAAMLAKQKTHIKPVGRLAAHMERKVYVERYSKLKDEGSAI